MRLKRAAAFAALAAISATATPSSPGAPLPAGWRLESAPGSIAGVGTWSVALPPAMRTVPVAGIGSYVAEYRSEALTLLFDFGAHAGAAAPDCRRKQGCTIGSLDVQGGRARRLRYYQPDPDGGLPYRASYEIPFAIQPGRLSRRIALAIRAECASASACDLADRIVRTIEVRRGR
jgi:hypothetical protein